jgi:Prokaryotic dksA/traR C4-type zinc finger
MNSKLCKSCGMQIPQARLDVLPDTEYCVEHSDVKPYRALVTGTARHKGFEVQVVKEGDPILDYQDGSTIEEGIYE